MEITLSLSDFLWIVGAISAIIACWKAIDSINPIKRMNITLNRHGELLKNDKDRIDRIENSIADIKSNSEKERYILFRCMQMLINNALGQASKDEMMQVSKELNEFILK